MGVYKLTASVKSVDVHFGQDSNVRNQDYRVCHHSCPSKAAVPLELHRCLELLLTSKVPLEKFLDKAV